MISRIIVVFFIVPYVLGNPQNGFFTDRSHDVDKLPIDDSVADSNLDWTLTKKMLSAEGNMLVFPLGLKMALAMLSEAATGLTLQELCAVLGSNFNRTVTRNHISKIIESLEETSPLYTVELNSRIIYMQNNAIPRRRFLAIVEYFYRTEVIHSTDDNPSVAAETINKWVANTTHGKVTNLVSADDVRNMAVLILNTLYFKGSWSHQFSPNATKNDIFYVTPKQEIYVPFMNVMDTFLYKESTKLDAKILRMPYQGEKFAMFLVVPNSHLDLQTINMNDVRNEINNNMQLTQVNVTIPKFKFDFTAQLGEVLKQLGVRVVFEDTASLPGIARGKPSVKRLKLSNVLQKSGIEVNEFGSVAYSVTELSLDDKFANDDESDWVIANKPFLFFIKDETTKQLLFSGKVADPSQSIGTFNRPTPL